MHLKGQMVYLEESNSILFLGSPVLEKLEQLVGKGIFISDIPIHDATRDVILVGEQSKAQVNIKDSGCYKFLDTKIFFRLLLL